MKKMMLLLVLAMFVLTSSDCAGHADGRNDSDRKQSVVQEQMMKEATAQVGLPAIKNFQMKKQAKLVQEECDREDLICHAYIVAKNTGSLVYVGRCMGYGLPYSVQYTNPVKTIDKSYNAGYIEQLPQADPNGLFMPTGLSATWVMMIDEEGRPRPVYFEPEIIISPFKLK